MLEGSAERRPSVRPGASSDDSGEVPNTAPDGLRRSQMLAMAAATGLSPANLHYCQPLLAQIAAGFSITVRGVSAVPTVTLIGYAVGLALFVPLGDIVVR